MKMFNILVSVTLDFMYLGAQTLQTLILCLALMWKLSKGDPMDHKLESRVVGTIVQVLRPVRNVEESNS